MEIKDLKEKISIRANEIVQKKINVFKSKIDEALTELFGRGHIGGEHFGSYIHFDRSTSTNKQKGKHKLFALRAAIGDTQGETWPTILWDEERDKIRNELLSQLDLIQKLLQTKEDE